MSVYYSNYGNQVCVKCIYGEFCVSVLVSVLPKIIRELAHSFTAAHHQKVIVIFFLFLLEGLSKTYWIYFSETCCVGWGLGAHLGN